MTAVAQQNKLSVRRLHVFTKYRSYKWNIVAPINFKGSQNYLAKLRSERTSWLRNRSYGGDSLQKLLHITSPANIQQTVRDCVSRVTVASCNVRVTDCGHGYTLYHI